MHLDTAVLALRRDLADLHVSSYIETEPEDVPDEQPPYLNAAVVGQAALGAEALLELLLRLEAEQGRRRESVRAARTLDLDLILYGDAVIDRPGLVVPHPRFRERRFVLAPLTEIAPDLRDPVSGMTVRQLLAALSGTQP